MHFISPLLFCLLKLVKPSTCQRFVRVGLRICGREKQPMVAAPFTAHILPISISRGRCSRRKSGPQDEPRLELSLTHHPHSGPFWPNHEGTPANIFTPLPMTIISHSSFTAKLICILIVYKTYLLFICLIR